MKHDQCHGNPSEVRVSRVKSDWNDRWSRDSWSKMSGEKKKIWRSFVIQDNVSSTELRLIYVRRNRHSIYWRKSVLHMDRLFGDRLENKLDLIFYKETTTNDLMISTTSAKDHKKCEERRRLDRVPIRLKQLPEYYVNQYAFVPNENWWFFFLCGV